MISPLRPLGVLLALVFVLLIAASNAHGWGERSRVTAAGLTEPVGMAAMPAPVVASLPSRQAEQLAGMTQYPMDVVADPSGALLVLSLTRGSIEVPTGNGSVFNRSLIVVRRIAAADLGDDAPPVETIGVFLVEDEGGFPFEIGQITDGEPEDTPVGIAIDHSLGYAYVSVPGDGIRRLALADTPLTTSKWTTFVTDRHDPSAFPPDADPGPFEYEEGYSGIDGEGPDFKPGRYGSLWRDGPTFPGAIAVDPQSHHVFVAEGARGGIDRIHLGQREVREFGPAGQLLGKVGFAAPEDSDYPASDGRWQTEASGAFLCLGKAPTAAHPRWYLGADFGGEDLMTRTAAMHVAEGGTLLVLSQYRSAVSNNCANGTYTGQVVRSTPASPGTWTATAKRASDEFPIGPNRKSAPPGIEDLGVLPSDDLVVPSAAETGLLVIDAVSLDVKGVLRPFAGRPACSFDRERNRIASVGGATPSTADDAVLILQQPRFQEAADLAQIIKLDASLPSTGPTGCEFTAPTEVERTDPELEVVGTEFTGAIDDSDVSLAAPFQPIADGTTVELESDPMTDGWVFSVRAADEDNGGDPPGETARCVITRTSGGVVSRTDFSWSACRAKPDGNSGADVVQGPVLAVTRSQLASGPMDLRVEISDDDDPAGVATFQATVRLRASTGPLEPRITANQVSRTQFRFVPQLPANTAFDYWRLDFGDGATPRRQPADADGNPSTFPNSRESDLVTYGDVGAYSATLVVGRTGGEEASATVEVEVLPEEVARPTTTLQPQSGAPCDTPLGIPLALVGLGDELLCVPADPCDVNTQELGLTRLPIIRPESCAGTDAGAFAASDVAAQLPLGSRPVFLARTLDLGLDRRIAARVRCGAGPTACAGSVRLQIPASGGRPAVSLGTARFSGLVSGKSATVKVKVSAAKARSIRRRSRSRVRVTVSPTAPAGFARPRADARTVNLTATKPRKKR